jgi:hypothetical protein
MAEEGSSKRDLIDALAGSGIEVTKTSPQKAELTEMIGVLLERAQQAGAVRSDVELPDLFGLVMGACAFAAHAESGSSQARMLSVVCDGLRATPGPAVS